jgi:predicted dithiol-disulfide oxidoreductase (DUF899 family)
MERKKIELPRVGTRTEWLATRKALLIREKQLTRERDALNAERRTLPMVRIEKDYLFETPEGGRTLAELFGGRSQLIVNHFMLGPGWNDGCVGCSFLADHIDGALAHLEHHDVSLVVVSRAPLAEIARFKARMGWRFKWVSSYRSDFNHDFHVSYREEEIANGRVYYNYEMREFQSEELPGVSVFYKDGAGAVFHTYSSYARGTEELLGTYMWLDLTPRGRNETGPSFDLTDWVRHHDRYDDPQ